MYAISPWERRYYIFTRRREILSFGLSLCTAPHRHMLISTNLCSRIIAIMLGRLGMTVDECLRAYKEVAQQAFTPKKPKLFRLPASPTGAFSATTLEDAIKKTVMAFCTHPNCASQANPGPKSQSQRTCEHGDLEFRDTTCVKTYVLRHCLADG